MDWLNIITTLATIFLPSMISIASFIYQAYSNKQNNDYQLKINEQNNQHQLKVEFLNHHYLEKISVFNNFIRSLHEYMNNRTDKNLKDFRFSMAKIGLYVSEKTYEEIENSYYIITEYKDASEESILCELLPKLNAEIHKYK